jgi:hypothetical protein
LDEGAEIAKVPRDTSKVTVDASVFALKLDDTAATGRTSHPLAPVPVELKVNVEPETEQPVVPASTTE